MDDNDLLVSLVENMVKIVVEVVRNLKIRQAKHRYRPQLYYVYRHQGHLAHSCSDQAKRECQEQMMNVRFMKIIDPKVGNYESRRRIGKGKREIISNGTVRNKVTQMKNRAIPVKSIGKGVELNKLKDNRAGVKRNEHEMFIHYQKSAQGDNPKRQYDLGLCYQYEASTDKGEKGTFELDLRNNEVIEESGDCRDKVVENEPVVVMEASLDEVIKIDAMMKGLLKTLMTNASDVKWSDDKKNMMVSSIIRDEIYMNDVIINDAPELNSKVQLIEYVDETSNVEDVSEFDLEMKMDGDASINQTSDGGETTGIEIEAPKDKGSTFWDINIDRRDQDQDGFSDERSANLDRVNGMFNRGDCYQNGTSSERDENKTFKWYLNSAKNGISNKTDEFESGHSKDVDTIKEEMLVFEWNPKGAEGDNSSVQSSLGYDETEAY
ncbi:hypothetical protein C2G38_2227296 [Gigaspora rosea]|uniref:Uncharacterized protein n=1 Tax=Gigaspora rosea TaxID=44941 RepID=A0A397U6E6_9GLOM|nr:hypothetical protein C2G38_2227296 [Gigaspora rosea]